MTREAPRNIEDWALHAYVDDEVPADMRAEIEMRMTEDPELAAVVEEWRNQKRLIREFYEPLLNEPLPPQLTSFRKDSPGNRIHAFPAMAAACLLLLVGGLAGWFAAHRTVSLGSDTLVSDALTAHKVYTAEVRHPVEVGASESDHLAAWLSKRIGHSFRIPDLTAEGYTLLGGRLLAAAGRPAAQLMYEDQSRRRITLFLVGNTDKTETAIRIEQSGTLTACYWLDGPLAFAITGELDRDRMMALAHEVYR
ncbi:MAG: anti-sigma factor, partial [Rhizobiales bacterium]|nr:anti-sigma factor [Hyphomicrobiales bacterium]